MTRRDGISTRSIHAGEAADPSTGAHGIPIYQNSTYAFRSADQVEAWRAGQAPHFMYARDGNPTVRCLELKLADLEGTEAALAGASGMAVIAATLLHLLAGGGHLVASADVYSVTRAFFLEDLAEYGASVTLVDITDPDAVAAAMTPATRAIFTESFSNPELRVANIPALAEVARRHGVPLVIDNTFLSPALLRPVEHGADVALHSATKYLAGHGQVLGGVVCGPRAMIAPVARRLSRLGGALSPFSAWLLLTGIKTLPLRLERHSANAMRLATLLHDHPALSRVYYPGLPSDPQHETAQGLVEGGFGGMLACRLGGGESAVRTFLNGLRLPSIAVSLGDVSTLVWPFAGTDLVRVSVGLEDWTDLEADFTGALAQTQP